MTLSRASNTADLVNQLAEFDGVDGCALVEVDTGMAWHYAGSLPDIESISEAAAEFWRVQTRVSHRLLILGDLHSVAYSFSKRTVALFPCSKEPALVLVCVAAKLDVNWKAWSAKVLELRQLLRSKQR